MGGFKATIAQKCKDAGVNYHKTGNGGIMYKFGDSLFYNKVKTALGLDRCSTFLTGSAPMAADVVEFFMGIDIKILDGYGLSEGAIVTANLDDSSQIGSIGTAIPGVKV